MSTYSVGTFGVVAKSVSEKNQIEISKIWRKKNSIFSRFSRFQYWSYGWADVGTSKTNINRRGNRRAALDNGERAEKSRSKTDFENTQKIEINSSFLMLLDDQVLKRFELKYSQLLYCPRNLLSEPVETVKLVLIQLFDNGQQLKRSKVTNFEQSDLNNQA